MTTPNKEWEKFTKRGSGKGFGVGWVKRIKEETRNQALEEAAQVAEKQAKIHKKLSTEIVGNPDYHLWREDEALKIAEAIRSLKGDTV